MLIHRAVCASVLAWAALATSAGADLRLGPLLSDHMVVQRGAPLVVWGWADAGDRVSVEWPGADPVVAKADGSGAWRLSLDPGPASSSPRTLTVRAGDDVERIEDVLVGEVWLCSGQSNMVWTVDASAAPSGVAADADRPTIRMFTVGQASAESPADHVRGEWVVCSPETVGGFSAVAHHFGRRLSDELGVPIGLVTSAWGGSRIEAWISAERLDDVAAGAAALDRLEDGRAIEPRHRAAHLYNGMLHPLRRASFAGACWYQGENNALNAADAAAYADLLPLMIDDWRGCLPGDLPFLIVQLASFEHPPAWDFATVRDVQRRVHESMPRTGLAVTIDIGDADDIHPMNKHDVGDRLARWALAERYGVRGIVRSGPLVRRARRSGDGVRVAFEVFGSPAAARGGGRMVRGFELVDAAGRVAAARARIDGDASVMIDLPPHFDPVQIRYAWAPDPADADLVNEAGLPASPFAIEVEPSAAAPVRPI